jgi:hypothetical protein
MVLLPYAELSKSSHVGCVRYQAWNANCRSVNTQATGKKVGVRNLHACQHSRTETDQDRAGQTRC